ncbi:LTA synthase family protein [Bordetella genomosp. 13]|uniref:LTA synthase family protein n=1 Tax=Bordetella genomosp. 13 TaxID=463040 RepID=UPI0011A76957|nr:LTA synthase family protein [Bordetella genomosp. 13]
MYAQSIVFIIAALALLSLSRIALTAWQAPRARASGRPWAIPLGGLRIDAHMIAIISVLPLALAPWVGDSPLAQSITGAWLVIAWLLLGLLELSTPQFIVEYDTRPNRLYIVYLTNPREVFTMLWRGYRGTVLAVVLVTGLLAWAGYALFFRPHWEWDVDAIWLRGLLTLAAIAGGVLAIRGTLKHRPINPSTVAFCGDALVNSLPLNSLYSVLYAVYSLKNERSSSDAYGTMPDDQMQGIVLRAAGLPPQPLDPGIPTLHAHPVAPPRERPRNLVMIVEESLGAQFVGHLGGSGLTPNLDRLAQQGWSFSNAYATGTRSVRGLEALVAGFPPSLSEAVLRLPDAQRNFFTLAQLLRRQGYRTCFVYGGEAHFDNMKSFFLGNGFDELHDLKTFNDPAFVGTWGASDEDMFARVHGILEEDGRPCFVLAFSVSNHSPWEYPSGRIEPVGEPASLTNTVRYADWALGRFFDRARQAAYWDHSVFMVAADHDARVGGAERIPLKHFQIPALILGADVPVRRDDRLISQIDLPVTVLSLLGVAGEHPMIGHDLTQPQAGGRAMMQYGESYGYLRGDILTVLESRKGASQFRYARPDHYQRVERDADLEREALAHVLWVERTYCQRAYTLPALSAQARA